MVALVALDRVIIRRAKKGLGGREAQQMALDERAAPLTTADREFDRIWYGQCADEVAPKSVALAPELLRDGGTT